MRRSREDRERERRAYEEIQRTLRRDSAEDKTRSPPAGSQQAPPPAVAQTNTSREPPINPVQPEGNQTPHVPDPQVLNQKKRVRWSNTVDVIRPARHHSDDEINNNDTSTHHSPHVSLQQVNAHAAVQPDDQPRKSEISFKNTLFISKGATVNYIQNENHNPTSTPSATPSSEAELPPLKLIPRMFRQACRHWYIIGTVVIIGSVYFKGWAALAQLSQPVIWLIVKAMGVPAWVSSAWAPIEDPAAVAGTSSSLATTVSPILDNFEVVISVIERTDHGTHALSEIAPAMPASRQLVQLSATAHYLNATNQSINIEWQEKLRSENWVLTQFVAKFRVIHEAELQESPWYWGLSRGLCYIPAVHNNFKACRVFLDRVLGQLEKLDEFALEARSFRQALLQKQITTSTGKGLRNEVCKLSDVMNEMDVGGKFKETATDADPVVLHRLGTYIAAMQSGMRMACEVAKDAQPQISQARERISEDVQIFNNLHIFLMELRDDMMDGTLPVERAIELTIEQIEKLLLRLV